MSKDGEIAVIYGLFEQQQMLCIVETWYSARHGGVSQASGISEWCRRLECIMQQNGGYIKHIFKQEIRSMERVYGTRCFHSIPYTIIPNSRLPRAALFYWRYNGEQAIYNGANSLDGFPMPAIAYCIVLYINMYCLLPYDSPPVRQ